MAIIGIDFGLHTVTAAVYDEDGLRVLKNMHGDVHTDALFGLDPKAKVPVVGSRVRDILRSHPNLAVEQIRRRMGENADIAFGDRTFTKSPENAPRGSAGMNLAD
jgi:molecular chaperone DnaK (HSP70)